MIWILERLKISLRFLRLSSFFWILVSSFRSSWMFICFYWSKPLIWVPVSFPSLLVPCTYLFISLCIAFTFSSILWPYSTISVTILITSVLNSASDKWLSLHCLVVFFLALWFVFSFRLYFFFLVHLLHIVRSRALGISQGGATHVAVLWCCMWGSGWRGTMPLAQLSVGFQSLPPLPTSKICPSGADSRVGGFVYALGPCESLQRTLLWGWEFLPPPQPPQVFSVRGFEVLFPYTGTLGCVVYLTLQLSLLVFLHANVGLPSLSAASCHLACPSSSAASLLWVFTLASHLHPSYQSGWMFLL